MKSLIPIIYIFFGDMIFGHTSFKMFTRYSLPLIHIFSWHLKVTQYELDNIFLQVYFSQLWWKVVRKIKYIVTSF